MCRVSEAGDLSDGSEEDEDESDDEAPQAVPIANGKVQDFGLHQGCMMHMVHTHAAWRRGMSCWAAAGPQLHAAYCIIGRMLQSTSQRIKLFAA